MRRVFLVALALVTFQISAWADGIDLVNRFGSISISNSGILSKGSQLRQFNGIVAMPGHSLGSVKFSTGALLSGSILTGGFFSDVGSMFQVMGRGHRGQPKGMIFDGAFVGPIAWTLVSEHGQGLTFELTGMITGQLFNGHTVSGTITQVFRTTQRQLANGVAYIGPGNSHLATTPEPGTMSLLGLGLVAIGTLGRRRWSTQKRL